MKFSTIGGHPVLDLLNTVDWRLDSSRRSDRLDSDVAALGWGVQFRFCHEHEATTVRSLLPAHAGELAATVRRVRELIYETLIDHSESAAAALTEEFRSAVSAVSLEAAAAGWELRDDRLGIATLAHRLSLGGVDFLTSVAAQRVRQCADDACGWVYLDTSPRGNRVWCSAAGCGDRNRARRHYQRVKAGHEQSAPATFS